VQSSPLISEVFNFPKQSNGCTVDLLITHLGSPDFST